MSAPISDDSKDSEPSKDFEPSKDSELSKYAPRQFRDQPRMPPQLHVTSAPTVPSFDVHEERRKMAERASWPEPVPEPPLRRAADSTMALIGRTAVVVTFAALVALLTIFAKPLWQGLNADSQTSQASKSSDRPTANNAPLNVAPNTQVAAAPAVVPATVAQPAPAPVAQPSANAQQQASLAPASQQEPSSVRISVRGVTDTEIRFGISAAFSGPTKELGQNMRRGIEAAFNAANASGGVHGRQLRLIAADDGYEPARAAETMKQLFEKDQVFGVVGNVGTPTAVVALPYALQRKMLFFGAFTGAGLLRSDPPDRYVFNYRASYAEETAAAVHYLVKVKRLKPEQIAVFAQQDAYGDFGLRRRRQGYPFARGQRQHNFAAQLSA